MRIIESLTTNHAKASLAKSLSKVILDETTTTSYLTSGDEDALYSCSNSIGKPPLIYLNSPKPHPALSVPLTRNPPGTRAALVTNRIDTIFSQIITTCPIQTRIALLNELKARHVVKRDKYRIQAYQFRQRGQARREQYERWARASELKSEAENQVVELLTMNESRFLLVGEEKDMVSGHRMRTLQGGMKQSKKQDKRVYEKERRKRKQQRKQLFGQQV